MADALSDLLGVVARVDDVEAHPLLDGQVAHARMLHEQVSPSLRQQRAIDLIPRFDRGQEMRLRRPAVDLRRGRGALRRLAAGGNQRKPKMNSFAIFSRESAAGVSLARGSWRA